MNGLNYMDIKELDMSDRTTKALLANNISTIKDLTNLTENDAIKLRNLGRKSFEELLSKMRELNLHFKI